MISSLQQLQSATATHSRNFLSNFQLSPPADEETGDVFFGTNRRRTRSPAVVKKGRALRSFFIVHFGLPGEPCCELRQKEERGKGKPRKAQRSVSCDIQKAEKVSRRRGARSCEGGGVLVERQEGGRQSVPQGVCAPPHLSAVCGHKARLCAAGRVQCALPVRKSLPRRVSTLLRF